MLLFIDTSQKDNIKIKLADHSFEKKVEDLKSQALLPLLEEALNSLNKHIKDVTEIKINPGPGSFTGLRVGMSVASCISLLLGIPVNSKFPGEGEIVKINYTKS